MENPKCMNSIAIKRNYNLIRILLCIKNLVMSKAYSISWLIPHCKIIDLCTFHKSRRIQFWDLIEVIVSLSFSVRLVKTYRDTLLYCAQKISDK